MVHFKFGRREGNIFLFNVRKTSWWPHQIFLMICLVLTAIVVQSLISVAIKESFDRRLINTNISIVALSNQNHD